MGLTLQFAIGDEEVIIEATKNFDFDFFDIAERDNKLADFSLHLIPDDLNLLVTAATELQSIPSFGLRENLDTALDYFDSEDGGAYLVDTKVRTLFATLEDKDVLLLTKNWFDKMNELHNGDLSLTDDALYSVKQLISICRDAEQNGVDLVHIWFS